MKNLSKILLSVFALFISLSFGFGAKIWLEPSGGDLISQCSNNIDIMIDTEGVETNTVGVSFYIDDTVFALNDLDTVGGIFPAYTSFVRGKAWHGDKKGQQTISFMGTTAKKDGFKGKGKLATLSIIPLLGVNSFDIEFYAIPEFSADDSNVNYILDGEVHDALKEAIGAKYNIIQGECPLYEAPVIISEDDQIILKTQEEETFFVHQMPFFKRIGTILINNINYIIIITLALFILFVFFRKKDNKGGELNKDKK